MRLLILGPAPEAQGPLPKISSSLAHGLQRAGCTVTVSRWGSSAAHESFGSKFSRSLVDINEAVRTLRTDRYDALLLNTAHDWKTLSRDIPLLLVVRAMSDTPIVVWLHGSQAAQLASLRKGPFKAASWLLARLSTLVALLSAEELIQWKKLSRHTTFRLVRYPMPDEGEQHSGSADADITGDAPELLFVGRLIPDKGVMEAINSMPRILAAHRCRLTIMGDGPLRLRAEQRVHELGLEDSISFKGYRSGGELLLAYGRAAALVLPTVHPEGFPVVILEALRAGLPIITTRCRGAADWLIDRRHVLFLRERTSDAIAQSVIELLDDPELMQAMRRENRKLAYQFNPDLVAADWMAAFMEALALTQKST